ncbi:MAG: hypothetical protein HYU80_03235 [Candidatus Blackburnbacteria bacterium]|nr:hypothetical protein [Candidatus Blackburnbacteria bacterium]
MTIERPKYKEQRSTLNWQQVALIHGQGIMGACLARELTTLPALKEELSYLIHKTPLSYEEIVTYYLFGKGLDLPTVLNSPFVRCFETTPQCKEDEQQFLSNLRHSANNTALWPELTKTFQEWAERRIPYLARGLKRSILSHRVIEPLTEEEGRWKTNEGYRLWRKNNPDQVSKIQKAASQKAAEVASARVFTPQVRDQIQKWFDRGLDYQTVVELLKGIGVYTTCKSLTYAARE